MKTMFVWLLGGVYILWSSDSIPKEPFSDRYVAPDLETAISMCREYRRQPDIQVIQRQHEVQVQENNHV